MDRSRGRWSPASAPELMVGALPGPPAAPGGLSMSDTEAAPGAGHHQHQHHHHHQRGFAATQGAARRHVPSRSLLGGRRPHSTSGPAAGAAAAATAGRRVRVTFGPAVSGRRRPHQRSQQQSRRGHGGPAPASSSLVGSMGPPAEATGAAPSPPPGSYGDLLEPEVRFVVGKSPLVRDGEVKIVKKSGRVSAKSRLQVSVHNRNRFPIFVGLGQLAVPLEISDAVSIRVHAADGRRFSVALRRSQWEGDTRLYPDAAQIPPNSVAILEHRFRAGELQMSNNGGSSFRFFVSYGVTHKDVGAVVFRTFPPQEIVFSPTVLVVAQQPAARTRTVGVGAGAGATTGVGGVRLEAQRGAMRRDASGRGFVPQSLSKSWDDLSSVKSDASSRSSNASSAHAYSDIKAYRQYRPGSPCSDVASVASEVSCRSELDDCYSLASGHSGHSGHGGELRESSSSASLLRLPRGAPFGPPRRLPLSSSPSNASASSWTYSDATTGDEHRGPDLRDWTCDASSTCSSDGVLPLGDLVLDWLYDEQLGLPPIDGLAADSGAWSPTSLPQGPDQDQGPWPGPSAPGDV